MKRIELFKNIRINYFLAFVILFAIEVFIALFVQDKFIRPYIGDVLVVILIYTAVRVIFPYKIKLLALYIFLFASFIEILQLINIVKILGFENNKILSIAIGSVFDIKDMLCYAVGSLLLIIFELKIKRKSPQ